MTVAFEKFIRQYKKAGSEKADGYSRDAFTGLNENEKDKVFGLLITKLPFSAEWLFYADEKKALAIVTEKEETLRGNSYAHVYLLQEELLKHTGDLVYQDHMIEDYPGYADYIRPLVIDAIGRSRTTKRTIDFLKQLILTETSEDGVARASRKLLAMLKIPREPESADKYYKRLVSELRSENVQVKLAGLKQVAKYEVSLSIDGL